MYTHEIENISKQYVKKFCGVFFPIFKDGGFKSSLSACYVFCSNSGKSASKACDELYYVYVEDAASFRVFCKWFSQFRSGNFSIEDAFRSGRQAVIENDLLK